MTGGPNEAGAWPRLVAGVLWTILAVLVIVVVACIWHPWTAWIP